MAYDMMDDESAPASAEDASVANDTNDTKDDNKSEETEDQLSLVPKHFFKREMKPGDREMVEVVEAYDGEYSIKCIYDESDDKEEESDDEGEYASAPEAEDAMMT